MKPTIDFKGSTLHADDVYARYTRGAAALQAAGVAPGNVVAVLMRNSPTNLEVTLATRWIGALWCPINWHFKTEEVQFILGDSAAKFLVADADLLAALPGLDTSALRVLVVPVDEAATAQPFTWQSFCDACTAPAPLAEAPRGAVFYTSGTTGRPKGIRRAPATPEQAASGLEVMRHVLGFEPGMRALVSAPCYHSAPNSYSIGAAQVDAHLFIEQRFDAEDTLRMIEAHKITHAYLVPTMYVRLLRLPPEVRAQYDISSLRFVASTGSPCPPDVKRAMVAWFGPVIYEAYGSSELGYMTRLDSHEALQKPGSAGKPLPGVQMAILDANGNAVPQGQAGAIYVHQPSFPDFTYIGNDAARARMEQGGLKTLGDVGYLDEDGYLFIVDRQADMVISGGVNIYPAEIEAVLQMMPGVADCAVFGIPDPEFGESLMAAIQPAASPEGNLLTPSNILKAVRAYLKPKLADYKLPRQATLHANMPREDTGKIFKRKLREPYWVGQVRRV
jgi:long-chain acyl-CoA synthetase